MAEILAILPTHGLHILTKFDVDWTKIVNFLFQRSPTRKPAEGRLLRRASWFCEKSRDVFRGRIFAVHSIVSVRKGVSMPEILQHKNPSQRLRSLRLAPIIGEILPIDFNGL